MVRWLAIDVGVGGDVARAPTFGEFEGVTPLQIAGDRHYHTVVAWLTSFMLRRVLIAHWGVGRERWRAGVPALGNTAKAAVFRHLPRQAMAEVLLLLQPPVPLTEQQKSARRKARRMRKRAKRMLHC